MHQAYVFFWRNGVTTSDHVYAFVHPSELTIFAVNDVLTVQDNHAILLINNVLSPSKSGSFSKRLNQSQYFADRRRCDIDSRFSIPKR